MTDTYMSTSAVAHGEDIATVLHRLSMAGTKHIEIGIGPRPTQGILDVIEAYDDHDHNIRAHANCPIGQDGRLLNQERDFEEIMSSCYQAGITGYTLHAPRKRDLPTWEDFLTWALMKFAKASLGYVSDFAVETMYPAREPYWLDSYDEVARFLTWADHIEWDAPLVADVAHLQIGVVQGTWTDDQVEYVLQSGQVAEFHFSDNDGIQDKHRPYIEGRNSRIDGWLEMVDPRAILVDEGRRREKVSGV